MESAARLFLFGPPCVAHEGAWVALPFERRNQLLLLLALRQAWVPRAELATLLWPEHSGKLASSNLRKTVFRLQAQPWGAALQAQGSALRFVASSDVQAFEAALLSHRLGDAMAAYRGDLLAGFDDGRNEAWTRWLAFERDRLRGAWRGAALARLAAETEAPAAIELSARLLEADPLDEAALREHMAWLGRAGQAAAARAAHRRFVARLEADLGLQASAELRALHDGLVPAARTPAPLAATPVDESFVGRAVELRRIADLLAQPECRLLCLIGPGGVGKTRLARRVLQDQAAACADGGLFVPLEDVETAEQLAARLAQALGLGRGTGRDPLAAVAAALQTRHMLLVLDNFEQLAAHAALLARLLQGAPRLKILVTSRVRLTVAGEWSMPLEGLPFPDAEDAERAEAFDAVRLFVNAARRVEPMLDAAAEAGAIADICRRVEGLPLALELAAAWVRLLPCAGIAAELRQGSELLRVVDAAQPARHASIELVFEQSWRRLAVLERQALARLSVFRGGFSAEAARAVAAASLPVLGALADKSLLRKDGARLHLHPLVQQLLLPHLAEMGDRQATQAAHAAYFHRWLARLVAVQEADRQSLRTIDTDFENCCEAWHFDIAQGRSEALAGSATVLLNYCDYRGRWDEGLALLQQAADSAPVQAQARLHALLLSKAAHLAYRLDRYPQAQAMAARALALVGRARELATRVQAVTVLASCALRLGRLADARRLYRQTLALTPPGVHEHNTAATLDHLALVEKRLGHYDEALRLSLESLAQHRRLGDRAGEALCLNNLAALCLQRQDHATAQVHLGEALAICERDGIVGTLVYVLANLTEVAMRAGDTAAAAAHGRRGQEMATAIGNRGTLSWMHLQLARVAARTGDAPAARRHLADGTRLAVELGGPSMQATALLTFAELLQAQAEPGVALQVLAFTVAHPSITEADRDELRVEMARRRATSAPARPWPGIGLPELLQRMVAESGSGYAGLVAALGGGGAPQSRHPDR